MNYSNKFVCNTFFSVLILTVFGCTTLKQVVVDLGAATGNQKILKATADLSSRQEHYLGRSIMARVLTNSPPVRSEALQSYVNRLGQYLALHSNRPVLFKGYRFVVVNDDNPAAMSAPGGFVAISMGMMKLIKDEDELASVLAHEIAHIALKHSEENIKNANRINLGMDIITAATMDNPNAESISAFSQAIAVGVDTTFNKSQEIEADENALLILRKSGYSTTSLHKVISRMPHNTNLLSRHPRTDSRMNRLLELTKNDSPFVNDGAKNRFVKVLKSGEYSE